MNALKKRYSPSFGGWYCLPKPRVLYQRPGGLRVLCSILAVPRTVLFWTEVSEVDPEISWSPSPSLGVTAPSAPITTGIALVLTFHISSSCSFNPWYVAVSRYCHICYYCLLLLFRNVALLFSTNFCGVPHRDLGNSDPYWVQMFLYTIPATWSCLSIYAVPACILHPASICWTVSGASLQNIYIYIYTKDFTDLMA